MKNFIITTVILLSFCALTKTYAQEYKFIRVGTSLPVKEFADNHIDALYEGGADLGFDIGYQYINRLYPWGLGMFAGVDFNYHPLQKDYKDLVFFPYGCQKIKIPETRYSSYLNLPFTGGINYTLSNNKIGAFVNVGVALNVLKLTDMVVYRKEDTIIQESTIANGLGYKLGCGIIISNKVTITVDYLALGQYKLQSHSMRKRYIESVMNEDIELKVDMVTVTIGCRI